MNNITPSNNSHLKSQSRKRARKEKTVPVLLRISETWLKTLNFLALDHQNDQGDRTTPQDLIRAAVEKCFINEKSISKALRNEGAFTEKEVFEIQAKLISLAGQSHP